MYIDDEGSIVENTDEWTLFKIEEMVDSIYSRMRILPYSEDNLITSITRYLTMVRFGVYKVIEDAEGIELEGGQIRVRGFCSRQKLRDALRDDYFDFIKPTKLNPNNENDIEKLIFTARYVKLSYNFDKFINLFIEDIIPTQAAVPIEGLVILANPIRIEVLGES